MRLWRLVGWVVVAGCYRPASETDCTISCASSSCPDDLVCDNRLCHAAGASCTGLPVDAAAEATPDAPPRCEPVTYPNDDLLPGGSSYVLDEAHLEAVYFDDVAMKILEGSADSTTTGAEILASERTAFGLVSPRLAPSGSQLFFSGMPGDGTSRLMRSDRMAAIWQAPVMVSGPLPSTLVPGTVSNTNPRHMVIEQGGFFEGTEDMDGQWSFGGAALDFGLMNQRDPSLSADGLHLVFAGAPLAGADAIYLAERDTLSQPFGPPRVLINTGGARTPFFTSDCQNVYFSSSGSVRRAH